MPGRNPSFAKAGVLAALLLLTQNLMPCSANCIDDDGEEYKTGEVVHKIIACNQDGTYMGSKHTCSENESFDVAQEEEANCPDEQICVASENDDPACKKADKEKGDKDDEEKRDKGKKEDKPDNADSDQTQALEPEDAKKPAEEEFPDEDEPPTDQQLFDEKEGNQEQEDEEKITEDQEEDTDMAEDPNIDPEVEEDMDEETQDLVEAKPDGEKLPDEDDPPTEQPPDVDAEENQEQDDEELNIDEKEEDTNFVNESNEPNEEGEDEDAQDEEDVQDGVEFEEDADEGEKDGDEDEEEAEDGYEDEIGEVEEGCVVGGNMLEYGRSTGPIMVRCSNKTWFQEIETICEDDGAVTELLSESVCPEMEECFPCGSVALCMSNTSDVPKECATDMENVSMVPDDAFDMDSTRDSIRSVAGAMSDACCKGIGSVTIILGIISVASVHIWY